MLKGSHTKLGKRNWIQFSLRSILVLTVLISLGLGIVRSFVWPYQIQRRAGETIRELGGSLQTEIGDRAWLQDWFGEEYVQDIVFVDLGDCEISEACVWQLAALPKLQTLVIGGKGFADHDLAQFNSSYGLKFLILDSTNATEAGVARLKKALPNLNILVSQRRAIAALKPRISVGEYFWYDYPEDVEEQFHDHYQYARELCFTSRTQDSELAELRHLPTVHSVTTGYARITDAGLEHLVALPKLTCLRLYDTQITDDGLEILARMTNLKELDLRRTQVTHEGILRLREKMPDTEIHW